MSWLERLLNGWNADGAHVDPPTGDPERIAQVIGVIEELRPMLRADGGDLELVAVQDGWVEVRLRGSCTACHVSDMTVHGALEPKLKQRFDWFVGVRTR